MNLSCPNTEAGRDLFAHSAEATRTVLAGDRGLRAAAVGQAEPQHVATWPRSPAPPTTPGAEAVTLVNTVMGMAIDPETRALPARIGPAGRRAVGPGDPPGGGAGGVRRATRRRPALPIVGVGGVASGADAAELLLAGATRGAGGHGDVRRPPGAGAGCGTSWSGGRRARARRGSHDLIGEVHGGRGLTDGAVHGSESDDAATRRRRPRRAAVEPGTRGACAHRLALAARRRRPRSRPCGWPASWRPGSAR